MIKAFMVGLFFGWILQRSRVNIFDKIGGFAMLKDFTIHKVLVTAIGVSSILLFIEIQLGLASPHIKPFNVMGIISGGIIFGMGMAILGYCPGTLIVSMGEGAADAVIGTLGGLLAGLLFVFLYPQIKPLIGPNLGNLNLYTHNPIITGLIVLFFGVTLIVSAFYIDKKREKKR